MTEHETEPVQVAIIGAGPAGIGAAIGLARRGIEPVLLVDRAAKLGGVPAKDCATREGIPTFVDYGRARIVSGSQLAERLCSKLAQTDTRACLECQVLEVDMITKALTVVSAERGCFRVQAEAIVFATGAREQTIAERGIAGTRPTRVLNTMQVLDLLNANVQCLARRPLVVGSDLIAYSAAAKLGTAGAEEVLMVDTTKHPRCSPLARLYFRRRVHPRWLGPARDIQIHGGTQVESVTLASDRSLECDAVVASGLLVPNTELMVAANIETHPPHQLPATTPSQSLSAPGCFVAGNALGGFHGAYWCYRNGRRVAEAVAERLARASGRDRGSPV